jgi:hypothetical protein
MSSKQFAATGDGALAIRPNGTGYLTPDQIDRQIEAGEAPAPCNLCRGEGTEPPEAAMDRNWRGALALFAIIFIAVLAASLTNWMIHLVIGN